MSADGFDFDVFLSHSSKDKAAVLQIAERLLAGGLTVWLDQWEIRPGDSIPAKIEEGLEKSAVLVLCMSANSLGSDWATVESQTFRFRDPLNRKRRLIPVRLDETEPRGSLRQFAYVDWCDGGSDEAYARLLAACKPPEVRSVIQRELRSSSRSEIQVPPATEEQILPELTISPHFAHSEPERQQPHLQNEPDRKALRVLKRLKRQVITLALSRDGLHAATGWNDKDICVWDLEGNTPPRVLDGPFGGVRSVALSADGLRVASGSDDRGMRIWDFEGGGNAQLHSRRWHRGLVLAVALSADGKRAICGSNDHDAYIWEVNSRLPARVLKGHDGPVLSVALSANGSRAVSGGDDKTVLVWDLEGTAPPRKLVGHSKEVNAVALSADGGRAISGSDDRTVRVWDLEGDASPRVLEGHSGSVLAVALSADGRRAISGSSDWTIRIWDLDSEASPRLLTGHSGSVNTLALSADGRRAISGSDDRTIRVWNLDEIDQLETENQVRYTNAKVVVVGETNSGKTGITVRLAHDQRPSRGPSTSGVWSTQWLLKDLPVEAGWDREVWLWDFGGQADQRLIHQLYLEHTAAVLLMFDAEKESVLPSLREWRQALGRSIGPRVPVLLLAGRTDVGCRFDRFKVQEFAAQYSYPYFETSAESGIGIPEVRQALLDAIPWKAIEHRSSPERYKRLKDEILRIRDEGKVIVATLKELESILTFRLFPDVRFSSAELRTVVGLLDAPGVVKELNFGSYVLLRPEWINTYAQAVIRTLRAAESGLGSLPTQVIREGKLLFQPDSVGDRLEREKRLPPEEEQIVLQSMENVLLERRLCLRQDGDLVFPSYCGLERPQRPNEADYFVSYTLDGFLDDIYATLVVKLAHCGAFRLKKDLWRDAADFETVAGNRGVGIRLVRREDGGELFARHDEGVTEQEQVLFANYIHEHLKEKSTTEVARLRHYACPACGERVENRKLAMERLREGGTSAKIRCQRCDKFIALWDQMERRFASTKVREMVEGLQRTESVGLNTMQEARILVNEVTARILSAGQNCYEVPPDQAVGIDMVVEFTDREGRGSGRKMYLQLKAGNSHLKYRANDGAEIFTIRKQSWVTAWTSQEGPVMLVIGTLPKDSGRPRGPERLNFLDVRWMEVGALLREESSNGTRQVDQIVFEGERLDAESVLRWRDWATQKSADTRFVSPNPNARADKR